jgi:hypothetical protein
MRDAAGPAAGKLADYFLRNDLGQGEIASY